jgi:glycosyltransferase involved in cell wall biosynthesis
VSDGVNGFLVPLRNASVLADALEMLILDKKKRELFGSMSRQMAVRNFSSRRIESETLAVYDRVMQYQ